MICIRIRLRSRQIGGIHVIAVITAQGERKMNKVTEKPATPQAIVPAAELTPTKRQRAAVQTR